MIGDRLLSKVDVFSWFTEKTPLTYPTYPTRGVTGFHPTSSLDLSPRYLKVSKSLKGPNCKTSNDSFLRKGFEETPLKNIPQKNT